jgi:copper transport protein
MARKCGAIIAITVGLLICTAVSAAAHAALLRSQPADGARIGIAPSAVVLDFSEVLYPALSHASVTDPGDRVTTAAPLSAFEIRVGLLTNLPGVYQVTWQAVSAADGHATHGSFIFTVEATSAAGVAASSSSRATVLDFVVAIARWIEDGALLLTFGMLFMAWVARRGPQLAWVRPRLLPPMVALAAGLVVVGGEAASASGASAGSVIAYFGSGPAGMARIARIGAEALTCIAISTRDRAAWPALLVALTALSLSGHAAGAKAPWLSVTLDVGHLVAAGVWVGGLMAMATLRPTGGWSAGGRALLQRFTPWALLGFGTSVCLGVLQASVNLGSASALLTTSYGRLLIAKAMGIAVMVPLSLLAWKQRRVHLRTEAAIGVIVIGAAALLASLPVPARSDENGGAAIAAVAASLPRGDDLTLGGQAGQTLVGLTLDPAAPGTNQLTVYVAGDVAGAQSVDVSARVNGQNVTMRWCGSTCRHASVSLLGGEPVSVRVAGRMGGTAHFWVPPLPAPEGSTLLAAALGRMQRLHSVTLHETLTGGAETTIITDYREVAPDLLEWSQPGGSTTVVIGSLRYTRAHAGATWTVETGNPPVPEPAFSWGLFSPYVGAHLLGQALVDGVRTTQIAFFAGTPATPVWFRVFIDDHGLVRRADMAAPGHFMIQTFASFDAPLSIGRPNRG